ncbi:MAG: homocysteine S-methyltransferase family protein [Firmicutes bacterium]|nr:homocysteine S-methyltransferase family protein [Bacillota bacterium]
MGIDFRKKTYILDGAMGTQLQQAGMRSGEDTNDYLLDHPDVVEGIHRRYVEAGSDIIYAPVFTVNRYRICQRGELIEDDIRRLMAPGQKVKADMAAEGREIFVALDMGPLGEMVEPLGALTFEEAYQTYQRLVLAGAKAGADLVVIETMTDLYETKAAVLAAKENCDLPVIVSMSFDEGGRTFTGTSLETMALQLEGLGADAVGINCSLGPDQIYPMIRQLQGYTSLPVFAKPNAGLPDPATGEYDITEEDFARSMEPFIKAGVNMIGGCCGTSPEYIGRLAEKIQEYDEWKKLRDAAGGSAPEAQVSSFGDGIQYITSAEDITGAEDIPPLKVSSRSRAVTVDHVTVIGERLNPTGKKRMKQALLDGDFDYLLNQAIDQVDTGAGILDVNVGVPGLDEVAMMPKVVKKVQSITDLPLQIDSSNPAAIEAALRVYNGKAIVNSVNGEEKVMDQILPLVKKYGAAVIGLTLDDKGIPGTAEERFAIAERILQRALDHGIPKQDVIIDCLTLTASAQQKEVNETLRAVRMVRERLGLHTALGVSNVSFGLPLRPVINRTFLTLAMENGLDLPIINPNDEDMMASVYAFNVLKNVDETAQAFIERYTEKKAICSIVDAGAQVALTSGGSGSTGGSGASGSTGSTGSSGSTGARNQEHDIFFAVERGLEKDTVTAVNALLEEHTEMEIVSGYMIPALDRVGKKFEDGSLFLPQMLQAAQAAQAGFEIIKDRLAGSGEASVSQGEVVIATVHGDIHDIGKNIVKVIMDNYGFHMIDLGKNVPAEEIVRTVKERGIRLVGLSALMTTTLKSMEETIAAVRQAAPECRVMVGGAVLTDSYAKQIGADYYCSDAMKSVEAAQHVFGISKS